LNLERSFYYHDALAAVGTDDGFDEFGRLDKDSVITACAT